MAEEIPHTHGGGPGSRAFSKKIAGQSIGVWLFLFAGAYVVVRYYRSRTSSSAGAANAAAAQQAAQDQLYGTGFPGTVGTTSTSTTTGTSGTGASYADNIAWQSAAVNWLVAHSYDAALANQAVGDYLSGNPLTPTEHAMVNLVVNAIGSPPTPPPPSITVPAPVTNPSPSPSPIPVPSPEPEPSPPPPAPTPIPAPPAPPPGPSVIPVTVVKWTPSNTPWNSTVSGIAAHYGYGGNWQQVWDDPHNAGLRARRGRPELIQPGDTVYVVQK